MTTNPTPLYGETIDQRFDAWLLENPGVFDEFLRIALEARRRGWSRWSADAILAVIRWERRIEVTREGGFRANDHFTSRLARKAIAERAELSGFFELRKLRS